MDEKYDQTDISKGWAGSDLSLSLIYSLCIARTSRWMRTMILLTSSKGWAGLVAVFRDFSQVSHMLLHLEEIIISAYIKIDIKNMNFFSITISVLVYKPKGYL